MKKNNVEKCEDDKEYVTVQSGELYILFFLLGVCFGGLTGYIMGSITQYAIIHTIINDGVKSILLMK